jgi:hypothetical protein
MKQEALDALTPFLKLKSSAEVIAESDSQVMIAHISRASIDQP